MIKTIESNFFRKASFCPATIDLENRTAELIWTTGARVPRSTWDGEKYFEDLSLASSAVRMERLSSGSAPLLNSHSKWDLSSVLGVVTRAWIDNERKEGHAIVRFSKRNEVEPIWQDVRDGIIKNTSVGYTVYKYQKSRRDENGDSVTTYTAVDWEPTEISMVAIGADLNSRVRSKDDPENKMEVEVIEDIHQEGNHMPVPGSKLSPSNSGATDQLLQAERARIFEIRNAVRAAGLGDQLSDEWILDGSTLANAQEKILRIQSTSKPQNVDPQNLLLEERKRTLEIMSSVRSARLPEEFGLKLIEEGHSLEQARTKVMDEWKRQLPPVSPNTQIKIGNLDATETMRIGMANALMHRSAPDKHNLDERGQPYVNLSLSELARECLDASGISTRGMSKFTIAERAFETSSDFPIILKDVYSKNLLEGYKGTPQTFGPLVKLVPAPDFKDIWNVQLSDAPKLQRINEDGEVRRGTLKESGERYRVDSYGVVVGVTRKVIVNDDLQAFTRIPYLFGLAASRNESDIVWGLITSNVKMSDGYPLFDKKHKNVSAKPSNPSIESLGEMRKELRTKRMPNGDFLNLPLKYIAVPPDLETITEQFLSQNIVPTKPMDTNPFGGGKLTLICDPRLTQDGPNYSWYGFSSTEYIDLIQISYLNGQTGIQLSTKMGFEVDGMDFKVLHDFGAGVVSTYGMFRNS